MMKVYGGLRQANSSAEPMNLREKIHNPKSPVVFYEIIPPALEDAAELPDRLKVVGEVASLADVINIPEIREEVARGARHSKFRDRMPPRDFARAIQRKHSIETVINRVTVHETADNQLRWLRESADSYGIRDLILVGGESAHFSYPGPGVAETARIVRHAELNFLLGGITIPSRSNEEQRVLAKHAAGIEFFTTQVLLESSHTISLLKSLEGVATRLILSFTPISHPKDLAFLEWLGVSVPADVSAQFSAVPDFQASARASVELAKRMLTEIYDHVTPKSPALGIQVERITKRNSAAAVQMLGELAAFYPKLQREKLAASPAAIPGGSPK